MLSAEPALPREPGKELPLGATPEANALHFGDRLSLEEAKAVRKHERGLP